MVEELAATLISPQTANFIDRLGFPIFVTIIMLSVVVWMMKNVEKRQIKSDERYSKIVDDFLTTMKQITREQSQAMQTITIQLERTVDIVNLSIKTQAKDWERVIEELKELKQTLSNVKKR